mgnify:CR=1 FL=1
MFARSGLSDAGYAGLPNITFLDTIKYWESNILANPRLDAIKFMLPLFGAHFGNSTGERALAVASAHHYPLVWALADGHHDQPHTHDPSVSGKILTSNERLLDPASAALLNVTLPANASTVFATVKAQANAARTSGQPSPAIVMGWWQQLRYASVRLAPLTALSCSAPLDDCVGVVVTSGDCACFAR